MAERWFLLAGESEYGTATELSRLEHVPRELDLMREALSALGMREIGPPVPGAGERGLDQARPALLNWQRGLANRRGEPPPVVFVYCTGHGYAESSGWGFVLPEHTPDNPKTLAPLKIVETLLGSDREPLPPVAQVMLVLDACFSQSGALKGIQEISDLAQLRATGFDAWVIAAARSHEKAYELAFARAFRDALAAGDGLREFVDPDGLIDAVNTRIGGQQQVWLGRSGLGSCVILPDPAHMPVEPPRLDVEWSNVGRGLTGKRTSEAGWFFSGRSAELRELQDRLAGFGESGLSVLRGAAGSGKSALLAHLAITGISAWRREVPPIVRRHAGLPPEGCVHAIVTADRASVDELARRIGQELALPLGPQAGPAELLDGLDRLPRRAVLVDDAHRAAADPQELFDQLLEPLCRDTDATIVLSARPGVAWDDLWRRHDVPVLELRPDLEGVRAYARTYLEHFGGSLSRQGGAQEAEAIAAACNGHFDAAAHAVRAFRDSLGDLAAARAAAGRRLSLRHLDLLGSGGRPDNWARAMLQPVEAAAACGAEAGLTAAHWAALASAMDLSGGTYSPREALEAAELLGPQALVPEAGAADARERAWRLAHPDEQAPVRNGFARAVRHCLPADGPAVDWARAGAREAWLLCDLARRDPRRFRTELDLPAFWLALPPDVAARAVHEQTELFGSAELKDAVLALAPGSPAGARAFRLKTALLRSGARKQGAALDIRSFGAPVEVRWAGPDRELPITGALAVTGGFALTAHHDASLRLWDLATGAVTAVLDPAEAGGTASGIALAVIGGRPAAVAVTGDGALLWRPGFAGGPELEHLALLAPGDVFALLPDGRLAVACGSQIKVTDLGAIPPVAAAPILVGRPPARLIPVGASAGSGLLAVEEQGVVTTWPLAPRAGDAARRGPVPAPAPAPAGVRMAAAPSGLAVSPSGRTLAAIGADGRVQVWGGADGVGGRSAEPGRAGPGLLAVSDHLVATATGGRFPALTLRALAAPAPQVADLPLLDPPVALAFAEGGDLLLVADTRGLICLEVQDDRSTGRSIDDEAPL